MRRTLLGCLVGLALLPLGCGPNNPPGGKPPDGGGDAMKREPVYEPLPDHQRVQLSNLRFDRGDLNKERYKVDWKVTQPRKGDVAWGMTLVIRPVGRSEMSSTLSDNGKQSGTMSGQMLLSKEGEVVLEKGCEMFVVIASGSTRYKISNSVTIGGAPESPALPAPTPP